jgi:hypothetical protein
VTRQDGDSRTFSAIIAGVARPAKLPWLLAGWLVLGAGCKAAKTEVAVTLKVNREDEAYRPTYVTMLWRGPSGAGHDFDQRLPATGMLAQQGDLLTTVLIEVDDATPGERTVVMKGWKPVAGTDTAISGAAAHVGYTPGQRVELTLFMKAWVDTNGNDVPDTFECPTPATCILPDAGATDDGGADAGDADAGDAGDAASDDASSDGGAADARADADGSPG